MFKGSLVALITPMREDGSVDEKAYAEFVDWQIKEGTNGVIPVGSQITADDLMGALGLPLRFVATSPLGGAAAVADLQLAEGAIRQGAADHVAIVLAHRSASEATI